VPDRLPVIVVDDDPGQLRSAVRMLEIEDWSVTGIADLDEAARVLVEHTDPFVLILDHDFERPDGQTGLDLTRLLRSAHPWGAVLPICYWSGRIDGSFFLTALRNGHMFAPSSYIPKGGKVSVAEVAEQADAAFQRFKATFEQQALRRAVLNLDSAIPVDDDLADLLDDDTDHVVLEVDR
jgi:CheY-like chemotaxis protein